MNAGPGRGAPDDGREVVRRLIQEVMNDRRLEVLDELYTPAMARQARGWIQPFLESFADVEMRIVELVVDGDRVVGRFACSGTQVGPWRGHPPTGKRFTNVPEVYFFRVRDERICSAWGLEDTWERMRQLGLAEA